MRRCPQCRALLPGKSGTCPFCGGEPEADLAELARAAGAPDPERFAAAAARPEPAPSTAPAPAAPEAGRGDGPGASDARDPRAVWGGALAKESGVSRRDEAVGFERYPALQALLVFTVILLMAGLIYWFWI